MMKEYLVGFRVFIKGPCAYSLCPIYSAVEYCVPFGKPLILCQYSWLIYVYIVSILEDGMVKYVAMEELSKQWCVYFLYRVHLADSQIEVKGFWSFKILFQSNHRCGTGFLFKVISLNTTNLTTT